MPITWQGLSGVCIISDLVPVNSYEPVGTYTDLGLIGALTQAQLNAEAAKSVDLAGMIESAQVQVAEAAAKLKIVLKNLPPTNALTLPIRTFIADLS